MHVILICKMHFSKLVVLVYKMHLSKLVILVYQIHLSKLVILVYKRHLSKLVILVSVCMAVWPSLPTTGPRDFWMLRPWPDYMM